MQSEAPQSSDTIASRTKRSSMRAFGSQKHQRASHVPDTMLRGPVISISYAPGDAFSAPLDDSDVLVRCRPMQNHDAVADRQNACRTEIKVVLKKTPNQSCFGFTAQPINDVYLQVIEIQEGILASYNQVHPERAICSGDCIVAVNGRRGDILELSEELRTQDTLEIIVAKKIEIADDSDDDMSVAMYASRQALLVSRRPSSQSSNRALNDTHNAKHWDPSCSRPLREVSPVTPVKKRRRPAQLPYVHEADVIMVDGGAVVSIASPATPSASSMSEPHTPEEISKETEMMEGINQRVNLSEENVSEEKDSRPPRKVLSDIVRLLPRSLKAPTNNCGHLYQFWNFVAQALLGSEGDDNVCQAFKLGGSIDNLSDVAFCRDHIVGKFGRTDDLHSIVWHHMLICWLGAGGPQQKSYQWLCAQGLAKAFSETDSALVSDIYKRIEALAREHGFSCVFDGDSRAVKFRLEKQQGEVVLQSWFKAVPQLVMCLRGGITPEHLDRELRSIFFVGELTAKELFVLFSYARPAVADTVRHMPVGPGARDGAVLVLSGEAEAFEQHTPPSIPRRSKVGGGHSVSDGLEATRLICNLQEWALLNVPQLAKACEKYRTSAPHRDDPLRNWRLKRTYLFDLADVEVMLCYYKNYTKLQQRYGIRSLPLGVSVRGWERRR